MNVAEALMVAEIGCQSGILKGRALLSLASEVLRLRKVMEEAGIDAAPQAEREEAAGATA